MTTNKDNVIWVCPVCDLTSFDYDEHHHFACYSSGEPASNCKGKLIPYIRQSQYDELQNRFEAADDLLDMTLARLKNCDAKLKIATDALKEISGIQTVIFISKDPATQINLSDFHEVANEAIKKLEGDK